MSSDDQELEVLDDVEWQVDADGTEFFVHEGQRYELGEDGYAYAVGPAEPDAAQGAVGPGPTAADDLTDELPRSDANPFSPEGEAARQASATPEHVIQIGNGELPAGGTDVAALLTMENVRSGYGQLPVLHDVTMRVGEGQTAVMLGLNGAGKTTTAMNICGALRTWGGRIVFDGKDVTSWSSRRCVREGIVLVPEGRRVFPELTVSRNLQIGGWVQRKDKDWMAEQREQVLQYFPRLRERLAQLAGTLSGGEQQMLAIARGLMARPKLLIIDEASMGLAPVIVHDVFEIIKQINDDGVTVLLIEQNVGALEVADLGLVMEQGHIVRELRGAELTDRSAVTEILMG